MPSLWEHAFTHLFMLKRRMNEGVGLVMRLPPRYRKPWRPPRDRCACGICDAPTPKWHGGCWRHGYEQRSAKCMRIVVVYIHIWTHCAHGLRAQRRHRPGQDADSSHPTCANGFDSSTIGRQHHLISYISTLKQKVGF